MAILKKALHTEGRTSKVRSLLKPAAVVLGIAAGVGAFAYKGYVNAIESACTDFTLRSAVAFQTPGAGDGFDPQDICFDKGTGCWFFSGHELPSGHSPLYVRDEAGTVRRLLVKRPTGADYSGHGAAVVVNDPYLYLTNRTGCMVLMLEDVLGAADGDWVEAKGSVNLAMFPAFMSRCGDMLYIGEFFTPMFYETPQSHRIKTPSGETNPAIAYAYRLDKDAPWGIAAEKPVAAYSIPGEVQGMAPLPDGGFVLSTSWGFGPSHLLYYAKPEESDGTAPTMFHDETAGIDVPLRYLDQGCLTADMKTYPSLEGIEAVGSKLYCPTEASNYGFLMRPFMNTEAVYALSLADLGN